MQNSTGWLFIILLVLILMISSTIYVSADAEVNSDQQIEAGEIAISKTAVPVSLDQDNREYTITLSAAGSKVISQEPLDVVLVLDTSESMGSQIGDTSETRLDAVKIAAKAFANSVLTDNSNSSVTVVKYAGDKKGRTYEDDKWISFDDPFNDASAVLSFSNDLDEINSCLDDLVAENGTNIEAGLYQARQELDGSDPDMQKVVVLISDGQPTLAYSTAYVSIESIWREDLLIYETVYEETYGITVGEGDNYDSEYRDKAVNEARLIRDGFDAKIFTVGISDPDSYDDVMYDVLNPSGDDRYHERYFEVTDTDSLNSAFASISGYINAAAENAVIVDVIGRDFELVEGTAPGAEIVGETLRWDLGVIGG
ncbi:MAG: VWA domain-containing protein, partial [Clostridiaceae bacterium]|nr:VWA domain-containing protein [Clostridiaceae bacterium]